MKEKKLIIMLFFIVSITFGQQKITQKLTRTQVESIDFSKTYNKNTGKKIRKDDYYKLLKNGQNIELEKIIGTNGKVLKYLISVSKTNHSIINSRKKPVSKGELFPNFIAKTIDNKKIELNKLKGKIIILRFELEANSFRFKKQEIKEIDNLIDKIQEKNNKVKAIIFFASNKLEIQQGFDLPDSNFEIIPNALNFQEKYSITGFPTTIVIDKNGRLVDYYKYMDEINLEEIINK